MRRKALEHFENEASMLQNLSSPLIVKLIDFFLEDHRGYLVLEYIDGDNLRVNVAKNGAIAERKVIQYGLAMCEVLAYLHHQSPPIIHRDFTPDNLILSSTDNIKLIDFMVAQQNTDTSTGTVVGKHAYLPPEQFRGKATLQSDIFALGCTLYFLLTGEDPEPLTTSNPILINDTVSGGMDSIVAKATALDPAQRYFHVEDLRDELLKLNRV